MANFENNMNIIERANKVLTFRKYIREECRKRKLEYPSDDKVAEWVDQCYGWSVEDFIKDYTEKEGIFREPIADFIKEVNKISWANKPTEEEIKAFFDAHGNNISLFCQERTISGMRPLERATLFATLKLSDSELVQLWNKFIEESVKYGEDSYIYDLQRKEDVDFINKFFPNAKKAEITRIVRNAELKGKNVRYFQWYNLNNNEIGVKDDIKGIIVAFWGEIFERILAFPLCYNDLDCKTSHYFESIFFPCMCEEIGYTFDEKDGSVKYK
jgi:hypothetical protein